MSIRDHRIGTQLLGVESCPHCGIASPMLYKVWGSQGHTPRNDGGRTRMWGAFLCTTCGAVVSVECDPTESVANPRVIAIFPDTWQAHEAIPERARNYLNQAMMTVSSPDASVVMSASSIDAMLKGKGLTKGTLYERINEAVQKGVLTQGMADWAHMVRLDSNNPRHADLNVPHMSVDDARRAFDFAKVIAEILYVLPSRMPAS